MSRPAVSALMPAAGNGSGPAADGQPPMDRRKSELIWASCFSPARELPGAETNGTL